LGAAAASAATTALAGALEPIQKDIADLRKAQYEAQGVKTNVGETRLNLNTIFIGVSIVIAAVVAFVIR
jgi:hypothetical protein